jgi:hypothetical protein
MLRPFLLVGVGGSGGKTLRGVRQALMLKLQQERWDQGWPEAWQFIHVDSPTAQDGLEFPAPLLDRENYQSLVPTGVNYASIYNSIAAHADKRFKADIERPLPNAEEVTVPVGLGAGAYRAIGRTIAAAALTDIHAKAKTALTKMQTNTSVAQLSELTKHFGIPVSGHVDPMVIVVSSIAGGSGAGMFIDVSEAVKSAAGGQPWADRIFGVLYAPDVFAEIKNMDAIAPNALAAISETMSGYWNNNPTESTAALYKSQGVLTANTVEYRMGPAFNYIVGRKNGLVDFMTQSGVYRATATSLASWMTDDKIQDSLSAYAVANFSSKAVPLTDNTGLKRENKDAPPFSSLGFARISLGMERFFEYSAERMAKEALQTIMNKHLETDPLLKEKNEEQWKLYFADLNEGRFFSDSGLYEETEENNQVIEALLPDATELQAQLKAAITSMVQQGMPKEGHSFNNWVMRICNAYEVNLPGILDELTQLRHVKVREWVDAMPEKMLKLVSQTISQQGLPVTVELIKRLVEQSKKASQDLLTERGKHLSDAGSLQNLVSQAMGSAATMTAIPPQNPTVAQAMHQAQMAFYWRSMADLKQEAANVMDDFAKNFLDPLYKELAGGFVTLRERLNDPKLLDGRSNPYAEWPDFKQQGVPNKFLPAPNERLLIDHELYPTEFDDLVRDTINDPKSDAKRVVIDQLIMGAYGSEELQSLPEKKQWKVVKQTQQWIPTERVYQLREAAPQAARFEFLTDHMGYVDRSKLWLEIPGKAFRAYLDQTIATYLSDLGDRGEQAKRQSRFVQQFEAAVSSANPLVELNTMLVGETHTPVATERAVVFSSIPVDKNDDLYQPLKDILVKLGYWNDAASPKWFVGPGSGAKKRTIDIFTQTGFPLQPIVMSSVMQPIAETWSRAAGKKVSRGAFMKWRRARTLAEAIPAHPDVWHQMVKGWYVMRLLNMFEQAAKDESYEEKGPKVSIWVNPSTKYSQFPYPLYYPGVAPVADLPGIIMESMTIAMVNCFEQTSLRPLEAYKRLFKLGDADTEFSELADWVRTGKVTQAGAPLPLADRAGTPDQPFEERQLRCVDWLQKELDAFKANLVKIESQDDVRSYPVTWEIRSDVIRAISGLITSIKNIQPEESL